MLPRQKTIAPRHASARPRLEHLEDRVLPTATVIEDFSAGLAPYTTVLRFSPNASVVPGASHDGASSALVKGDGYEWLIRNDDAVQVQPGDTISAWVDLAGNADGRAYFAFGAAPNEVNNYLRTGGALALVLAPNSNELLLEAITNTNANNGFVHVTVAAVPQRYGADHWYRAEVVWGTDGALTGNLYDSDGVTLLNSVSGTSTARSEGGIGFRGFGSDKYFDTVTVDDGTAGPAGRGGPAVDPGHRPAHRQGRGAHGRGGLLDPFQYQPVPGTGRDIWLAAFDQLQQYGLVDGVVGLAAANRSENHGNPASYWGQMGWGPVVQGLNSTNQAPIETPLLQQYIFRQLPGQDTTIIGRSDVKHFFLATGVDGQQLRPGEEDTYGSSLNSDQDYYSPQQDVDPVTGMISNQALDYFGNSNGNAPRNLDGVNQFHRPSYSSRIEHLLQVNVADLDPARNPAGTRWYLAGNIFVPGDEDVSHTSRWVEIVPTFDGSTFHFAYPNGSGGQYDVRTIPGLAGFPPVIVGQTPAGSTFGPVRHLQVTFSHPIDVSTFTPDKITSFTGPGGDVPILGVTPVDGSNDTRFDITFPGQGEIGSYQMVIGPDIEDVDGMPMAAPYVASFSIIASSFGPDGFGYTGSLNPFEDLELYQNGGTPMLFTTNHSYYGDDEYGTIDLGADSFNFYGTSYTGASKLFVSSNGLITFNSGTTAYANTNLTSSPTQAAIAPLWSDWVKTANDPGGEMILYKFEDLEGGGRRLIIEWNKIRHYNGDNSLVTFQAILSLDTGSEAGGITFNYPQITTGDSNSQGATATVGIKDAGTQGPYRLLASFNAVSPFVTTGQAILISAAGDGLAVGGMPGAALAAIPTAPSVAVVGASTIPFGPAGAPAGGRPVAETCDAPVVDSVFASSPPRLTAVDPGWLNPDDFAGSADLSDPLA